VLKANKDIGFIQLDSETQLSGVPREAGTIASATARRSNGSSTSIKRRLPRIRPSARSSTTIVSPITKRR
jgi:hypothetical protein